MTARRELLGFCLALGALIGCAGPGAGPALPFLATAPGDDVARIELADDRVVALAVPIGPGMLPPAVRTAVEAIAPGGTLAFCGFEAGPRGAGYRVEKRYAESGETRALLATRDGAVLERWHSVPVREVPTDVLQTVAAAETTVDEARIVSGPAREEHWQFLVRDRLQRRHVLVVGLRGGLLAQRRRLAAEVDG